MKKTYIKSIAMAGIVAMLGAAVLPLTAFAADPTSDTTIEVVINDSATLDCTQGGTKQVTVANGAYSNGLNVVCQFSTNNAAGYKLTFTTSDQNGGTDMIGEGNSSNTIGTAAGTVANAQTSSFWGYEGTSASTTVVAVPDYGGTGLQRNLSGGLVFNGHVRRLACHPIHSSAGLRGICQTELNWPVYIVPGGD